MAEIGAMHLAEPVQAELRHDAVAKGRQQDTASRRASGRQPAHPTRYSVPTCSTRSSRRHFVAAVDEDKESSCAAQGNRRQAQCNRPSSVSIGGDAVLPQARARTVNAFRGGPRPGYSSSEASGQRSDSPASCRPPAATRLPAMTIGLEAHHADVAHPCVCLCLLLLFAFLVLLLFAVRMEAIAPAQGIISARDVHEARTPFAGLIEPGWYDGELSFPGGMAIPVRLDAMGNGMSDPSGPAREVVGYRTEDGRPRGTVNAESIRFHRLQPGDELWGGQVLASLRVEESKTTGIAGGNRRFVHSGDAAQPAPPAPGWLRNWLSQAVLGRLPTGSPRWQVIATSVKPLQSLAAGDLVAIIVPWDQQSRRAPHDLVVQLKLEERHLPDVAPGQACGSSAMPFNQRLESGAGGHQRIEPWGEVGADGRKGQSWQSPRCGETALPFRWARHAGPRSLSGRS